MILQFTNKQIFFALESIWTQQLDYRFKTQINTIVSLDSDEDTIQNVDVSVPILMQCYQAMSSGQYGCTTDMAEILLESLRDQLLADANMTEYMTYLAEVAANDALPEEDRVEITEVLPNEQTQALLAIISYKEKDLATTEAKILNGKLQILA